MSKTETPNIGWLFYKAYYRKLEQELRLNPDKEIKELSLGLSSGKDSEGINDQIIGQRLSQYETHWLGHPLANATFTVRTTYPGLLAGLGAQHSIGHEDEIKLGFSFDHTTGLPYLPASSVKGMLRSCFPSRLAEAANTYPSGSSEAKALHAKARQYSQLLLRVLLPKAQMKDTFDDQQLALLEKAIFEGQLPNGKDVASVYERDLFFDAYPVRSHYRGRGGEDQERFLGLGAITPHGSNPLKSPTPLRLLKVLPEVSFQFQFRLQTTQVGGATVSPLHKVRLFTEIINLFGLGAKTNVGYGNVKKVEG